MYSVSIPVVLHGLKTLDALLKKAEAHCEAKKIDPNALLTFRLFPDMFPLVHQVQLVTDFAKGCGARLSGTANPAYADDEKTFAELHARIAKTIDYLSGLPRDSFKDAKDRELTIRVGRNEEKKMSGEEYFNRFMLPNFYFHMTTAYNILRHNGVELGKGDFMGRSV